MGASRCGSANRSEAAERSSRRITVRLRSTQPQYVAAAESPLNEAKGGARTYVVSDRDRVVAFYSLAASSVERRRVSSRVGRSMPEPVPVILLGQLAVDAAYQRRGLGADLLIDAGTRSLAAAKVIGARAIIVQALDDQAARCYQRWGFRPFSDREPLMLILRISELSATLRE